MKNDNYLLEKKIMNVVCEYFKVSEETIKSKTRKTEVIKPKHIIIYFWKQYKIGSLKYMAKKLNLISHSSCINAIKKSRGFIDTDKNFRRDIEYLKNKITVQIVDSNKTIIDMYFLNNSIN